MSVQITTAFVDQFKANILLLSQQKESRLRQMCRMESVTGDTLFVERVGATEAQEMTTRHGDTPQIDTPHSRRKLTMADYNWADLVDNVDRLKMLIDPDSTYAQNAVMAFNRKIDDVIRDAVLGAAYSGHTGSTTVNMYDSGECRLVESDGTVATAGSDWSDTTETSLTIAKLLTVKRLLDDADVDPDRMRYFVTNPYNIGQLLNTTEVKSSDYNTVKALAQGHIDTFMGFKFIQSTRLEADDTDTGATKCWACAQDAIVLAVSEEPTVRISERDDKNYSTQVYVEMSLGATRVEGPAVVGITLDTE
jgi:hypothetical protein